MNYKIVADSSSNIFQISDVDFAFVPMKVTTSAKEYVDTPELDVDAMVAELKVQTGRSGSSCPNTHEWLEAFGDADCIFGITITSKLSGSYSSAMSAREEYLSSHPGAKVHIIDSLSAGPELQILVEMLRDMILSGKSFEKIEDAITDYQQHTHLVFMLKSLNNFARNGRISPAVAKAVGILGICIVGKATEGTLDPVHKCRGEKSALKTLLSDMERLGYKGGKVRIAHCQNESAANHIKNVLGEKYPGCDVEIDYCKGLCSYYAEVGGLLVGFEDIV